MSTKQQLKTEQEIKNEQLRLSNAIMLAIELDSSFKLYSFHILSPLQYQERVDQLLTQYKTTKTLTNDK